MTVSPWMRLIILYINSNIIIFVIINFFNEYKLFAKIYSFTFTFFSSNVFFHKIFKYSIVYKMFIKFYLLCPSVCYVVIE